MKHLLIILSILPAVVFGQSAAFFADTSRLMEYNGHGSASLSYGMQMQWIIKGQTLHWGDPSIDVLPSATGLDTIFFQHHDQAKWDTMICKMQANMSIRFVYNPCCDYFDVEDKPNHRTEAKVSFQLIGINEKSKKYLGSIDGNGILVTSKADTITPVYRSPMLPNCYNVAINEIKKCGGEKCSEAALIKPDGSIDVSFKYSIVNKIVNFTYLQLGIDPINIIFNSGSGELKIN